MPKSAEQLRDILTEKLKRCPTPVRTELNEAREVLVFGSVAADLARVDSDIDVLCVGSRDYHFKSDEVELIIVSQRTLGTPSWLEGELAAHIIKYGVWVRGTGQAWKFRSRLGPAAIAQKRRRVSAFMRSLQRSWDRLDSCFKHKYATKVRREAQRLVLLERGDAVPPTRILDDFWAATFDSSYEVCAAIERSRPDISARLVDDLMTRIAQQLKASSSSPPDAVCFPRTTIAPH